MTITRSQANTVRWSPEHGRGHVESWFIKANHPSEDKAFWLKLTILCPDERPEAAVAEVWAVAFDGATKEHKAAKETYPIGEASFGPRGLDASVRGAIFREGATSGRVTTGDTTIAWDLASTTASLPLVPFPYQKMYELPVPRTKLVTPSPDERFTGSLTVDGVRWRVDSWPGMQGHNWGSEHSHRYAWVHSNAFDGMPGTCFEGFSAEVALGPLITPPLTIVVLRHLGQELRFDDLLHLATRKSSLTYYEWLFEAGTPTHTLSGRVSAPREDMVGLYYMNPSTFYTYCLNAKIATATLTLLDKRSGRTTTLTSTGKTAFELATTDAKHGVPMYV